MREAERKQDSQKTKKILDWTFNNLRACRRITMKTYKIYKPNIYPKLLCVRILFI